MTTLEELAELKEQHAELRREHREAITVIAQLLTEKHRATWSSESVALMIRDRAFSAACSAGAARKSRTAAANGKGRPHR